MFPYREARLDVGFYMGPTLSPWYECIISQQLKKFQNILNFFKITIDKVR